MTSIIIVSRGYIQTYIIWILWYRHNWLLTSTAAISTDVGLCIVFGLDWEVTVYKLI